MVIIHSFKINKRSRSLPDNFVNIPVKYKKHDLIFFVLSVSIANAKKNECQTKFRGVINNYDLLKHAVIIILLGGALTLEDASSGGG